MCNGPCSCARLRELRTTSARADTNRVPVLSALLKSYYRSVVNDRNKGAAAYMDKPGENDFGQKLHAIARCLAEYATQDALADFKTVLSTASRELKSIADNRHRRFTSDSGELVEYYQAFDSAEVERAVAAIDKCGESLPHVDQHLGINEDSPIPFPASHFPDLIEQIATEQGQSQYVDTLILRMRMLLADMRLMPVLTPSPDITLEQWLGRFLGDGDDGALAIVDLSLVSSDVLHVMIAVVARIVFEATQRYRKLKGEELPTVLVLEEAHTFVKRGGDDESDSPTPAQVCRHTFERIAREGRKFGLGLVLASQRPSELSPTVLAQCNTFLLHRIVNDRDQELVAKLVPDNLGGLLRELPSLPSRQAILLGWATAVPTLVEILELPENQRPRSSDPEFWNVWTGEKQRPINWREIVDDWTGIHGQPESFPTPTPEEEEA